MTDPFANLPRGHFGCILADPPWHFQSYDGVSCVPTTADDPYSTMTLDDLKALPVADVAADDCLLVMWVVSSHLPQALELGATWGFTYRSLGPIWPKEKHPGQPEMFDEGPICELGMGYWFRQQAEISLVLGRGSPTRLNGGVRQMIFAPRQQHSRKPAEQYRRIESLVAGPYLELFARAPREGWTVWGNETDKFARAA
jgi:N6-adenosine-specific RNA methylase IME4